MREQAYIDWLNECLAAVKASSYKTPSPGL